MTLAASAALTASAFAADLYIPEQPFIPTSPASSWSGAYVGVHVGYGFGEAIDIDNDGYTWDMSGLIAGAQAGVNYQMDGIVLGLEADIAWTGVNGPYLFNGALDDEDYVASISWMSTLRGRVGVDLDGYLVYGTAGVAIAGLFIDYFDDDSAETHVGFAVGAGVEKMITETISLKAEYLYANFGAVDHYDQDYPLSFDVHTVKAGLNFHF
ncbi:outer membrane protein [Devosia enhydra]|nr:outer membrane protein [Devosia enhydra]